MVFNLMVFHRNNYIMEFAGVYPTLTFNENRSDQKPATHGSLWGENMVYSVKNMAIWWYMNPNPILFPRDFTDFSDRPKKTGLRHGGSKLWPWHICVMIKTWYMAVWSSIIIGKTIPGWENMAHGLKSGNQTWLENQPFSSTIFSSFPVRNPERGHVAASGLMTPEGIQAFYCYFHQYKIDIKSH